MLSLLANGLNVVRILTIPAGILYLSYLYFYTDNAVLVRNGLNLVQEVSLVVYPLSLALVIILNYYLLKFMQRFQTQGQKIALKSK